MANGDVIKQVRALLQDPDGMTGKTATVMTLTLLADLYGKWESDHDKIEELYPNKGDHEKVSKMWPIVQAATWLGGAIGIANISIIVGLLTHTISIP